MEERGMTEMQYKSFLKQLISNLEEVKSQKSKEDEDAKLEKVIENLRTDLQN